MKQTLDLGANTRVEMDIKQLQPGQIHHPIAIFQDESSGNYSVYLSLVQANELREWLNKNLPR